jgi:hypothetical protein
MLLTSSLAALLAVGLFSAAPSSANPATTTVSIGDASGLEHADAQAGLFVPVTLSAAAGSAVTVQYWTVAGTATSPADYSTWGTPASPRSITIPAGSRQTTINVPVKPDVASEGNETFSVVLGSVTSANASVGRGTGTATIVDSSAGSLVSNVSVLEGSGNAPAAKAQFRVEFASVSNQPRTVSYSTANGTAVAGTDYTAAKPNSVTFSAGQTSKTVDVTIAGNDTYQGNRSFALNVTGAVAGTGTATILDDETAPVTTTSTTTTSTTTTTTTTTVPPTTTTIPSGPVGLSANPITVADNPGTANVTVYWNGQAANKLIFISVCRKSNSDATFTPALDCAPLSELNPNGTPSGSGSATLEVFRGPDPSGDLNWGCFAASDVAPAGIQKNTTCYVRVTNNVVSNKDAAQELAFTIVP